MKKVFIIARHEFLAVVTRQSYIFSVITLPLVLGMVFIVLQSKTVGEEPRAPTGVAGVIDQAGLLDLDLQKRAASEQPRQESGEPVESEKITIKRYEDMNSALNDLQNARLDILYVIKPEYLQSGEIDVYGRETRHLRGTSPTGYASLNEYLRAGLIRRLLPDDSFQQKIESDAASRLIAPPKMKKLSVSHDGTVGPMRNPWERISAALAPITVAFLLALSVFLSSGSLLEATVEENKNRVMEIILSSVEADQLIWGKILGLVCAGLLQVFLYLILISMATVYLWVGIEISFLTLAGYFVYWMLGHLLFAGLLLATGILLGGQRESNQIAVIWLFPAVFPIFFTETLIYSPNGLLARTLSYIPLTSPITMVFRMTKASVPIIDVVISLLLLLVGIYLAVRGAAKILRAGSLMYGKRFSLPELARWLREA